MRRQCILLFVSVVLENLAFGFNSVPQKIQRARIRNIRVADSTLLTRRSSSILDPLSQIEDLNHIRKPRRKKEANLVIEDDTLDDKPYMIAIVTATFLTALLLLSNIISEILTSSDHSLSFVSCVLSSFGGILFADAFTGIFHWSVDNYGDLKTPIFGSVIEAFQGHHGSPWTITYRNLPNNLHKICYGVLPLLILLYESHASVAFESFGLTALMGLLLCQEIHKYSHMTQPPPFIAALQSRGIILSRRDHGSHHLNPFGGKYCIVTGHCNGLMDRSGIYRRLEGLVFVLTGIEPNCWQLDESGDLRKEALISVYNQ